MISLDNAGDAKAIVHPRTIRENSYDAFYDEIAPMDLDSLLDAQQPSSTPAMATFKPTFKVLAHRKSVQWRQPARADMESPIGTPLAPSKRVQPYKRRPSFSTLTSRCSFSRIKTTF